MRILGIDFGLKKIGMAVAEGSLAEPFSVIRYKEEKKAIEKIQEIVRSENVDKVVVGVSEGEMLFESKKFCEKLAEALKTPVVTFDETLSTRDAQTLSQQAGIKRKKRKKMEDAFAATVMLQLYLDGNV